MIVQLEAFFRASQTLHVTGFTLYELISTLQGNSTFRNKVLTVRTGRQYSIMQDIMNTLNTSYKKDAEHRGRV